MKLTEFSIIKTSWIDERIILLKEQYDSSDDVAYLNQLELLQELKKQLISSKSLVEEVFVDTKYRIEEAAFVDNHYGGDTFVNYDQRELDKAENYILNKEYLNES